MSYFNMNKWKNIRILKELVIENIRNVELTCSIQFYE